LIRNGWRLYEYPHFASEIDLLEAKVSKLERSDPDGYRNSAVAKLLAAIRTLVQDRIPADPHSPEFRQGNTLGKQNRSWFRAKFHSRYRLFFRYSTPHRAIVYVWMSSDSTLRKAGSKSDPYSLFATMLNSGDPPADFDELLKRSHEL
jgi:toxin YhaV